MFRLAKQNDFENIKAAYLDVIKNTPHMKSCARWIYGQHPTDSMIRSYIDGNSMYVLMDGEEIAGMMAVTMSQGEDYHDINWGVSLNDDEVAVIHILSVRPAYHGKGVGRRLIEEAKSLAKEKGKLAVRLDALSSNVPAQRMYEGMGFIYRDRKNLFAENTGWTDFFFYELILG